MLIPGHTSCATCRFHITSFCSIHRSLVRSAEATQPRLFRSESNHIWRVTSPSRESRHFNYDRLFIIRRFCAPPPLLASPASHVTRPVQSRITPSRGLPPSWLLSISPGRHGTDTNFLADRLHIGRGSTERQQQIPLGQPQFSGVCCDVLFPPVTLSTLSASRLSNLSASAQASDGS